MALIRVKLVVLILPCCAFITFVKTTKPDGVIVKEWKEAYSEVFGNDSDKIKLSDSEIMERVTFMQEEMDEINGERSITREQIEVVLYWNSVLMDTDTNNCNTNHLRHILRKLKDLGNPPSTNQASLFWLVHWNLIDICNKLHSGIKQEMQRFFSFETYAKLLRISFQFELWLQGLTTKKELSKELFEMLHVDKTVSRSKIVKAWDNGPCKQVIIVLQSSPKFRSFYEFVELNAYGGLATIEQCPSSTYLWVRIVYACEELTMIIPELARENSMTTVANRRMKFFYRGLKSTVAGALNRMAHTDRGTRLK